ncbi:OmpA family protein [Aquimarina rhabdastrellae]
MRILLQRMLLIVWILVCGNVFSQNRKLDRANKAYKQYEYIEAQEQYLNLIEKGEKSAELYQNLGNTYYFNSQFEEAGKWYKALIAEFPDEVSPEYYFRCAQALKAMEKYEESDKYMKTLAELSKDDQRAKIYTEIPDYLEKIEYQSGRYDIINLAVNSVFSDFGTSFYKDKIVFSSARDTLLMTKSIHEWNNQSFLDLYVANKDEATGELSEVDKMDRKINTKFHESTSVFSKDGNTMYFTRNNYTNRKYKASQEGTNKLKIYKTTRKANGKWTTPFPLSFTSDEYSTAHPTLSEDGKTLYFSSDMPGGYGLSDIYKVVINDDGTFGEPENLGDRINTEGRDSFPFVSGNDELYFASNGHIGLGGFDVYVVKLNAASDEERKVVNIGKPVNGSKDDFAFVFDKEAKKGYFSSNRNDGKGSDDIYAFVEKEPLRDPCKIMITGVVKDKKTQEVLADALVVIFDEEGQEIDSVTTKADGTYSFEVKCKSNYTIKGNKEKYSTAEEAVTTPNKIETIQVELIVEKEIEEGKDLGKILALNPIYFDFDQWYIRKDAAVELDKVVAAMNKYPELVIEVRSHTDSHGDANYNLELSDKRAKATAAYIIERGIAAARISGRGFGETQPVNDCKDGSRCKKSDYQANRRSEFIIIEEAK